MTTITRPARWRARHATTPVARLRWHLPVWTALGTLGAVVLFWLPNGGLNALNGGPGAWVTSIGRFTGLVAADLLLIQVVMLARVPWIERQYGQDVLARWHRLVGFTSFGLMLSHIAAVTLGYAGIERSPPLREAWSLVTTYPGMLLATAGTAALVMVAFTSMKFARARLRYESWHLLHLYAYLGVGLSLPHEFWTGADFARPAAQVFWWTLYAVAAGSTLLYRIALPLWRSARHGVRVDAVVREMPGITSIYLRGRDIDRLPVRAGQFFLWRFRDRSGWTRANPFSLSAAPRPDPFAKKPADTLDDLMCELHVTRDVVDKLNIEPDADHANAARKVGEGRELRSRPTTCWIYETIQPRSTSGQPLPHVLGGTSRAYRGSGDAEELGRAGAPLGRAARRCGATHR